MLLSPYMLDRSVQGREEASPAHAVSRLLILPLFLDTPEDRCKTLDSTKEHRILTHNNARLFVSLLSSCDADRLLNHDEVPSSKKLFKLANFQFKEE